MLLFVRACLSYPARSFCVLFMPASLYVSQFSCLSCLQNNFPSGPPSPPPTFPGEQGGFLSGNYCFSCWREGGEWRPGACHGISTVIQAKQPVILTLRVVIPTLQAVIPTLRAVIPTSGQSSRHHGQSSRLREVIRKSVRFSHPTLRPVIPTPWAVIPTLRAVIPTLEGSHPGISGYQLQQVGHPEP
jgi:hypothetical protein